MDSKSEKSHTPTPTPSFTDFLKERGMVGLEKESELIEKVVIASRMRNLVPAFLIRGPPGTGKTTIAELYASYINAKKFFIQLTPSADENDVLYNIVPDSSTPSGFKLVEGVLIRALKESHKNDVVIILDEIDKTRPRFDAFLLDFLQNCRITVNIDNEVIIHGNKNRIIVFMTSNDVREFSEALLRRVVQIRLQLLPTIEVYKLMLREFGDERIAAILAQIYDDTINANLSKPATIQELRLAGELLRNGVDLETVVTTTIIKIDDDLRKYIDYIERRKPYQWSNANERNAMRITSKYSSDDDVVYVDESSSASEEVEEAKEESIRVPKIRIADPEIRKIPETIKEEKTVSMIIENSDDEAYTAVAKLQQVMPTDNPNELRSERGTFKLVKDSETLKEFIIRDEPLALDEIFNLSSSGKFYIEDDVAMCGDGDVIKKLISNVDKVRYYTASKVAIEKKINETIIKAIITIESKTEKCFIGKIQMGIDGHTSAAYFLYDYIVRSEYSADYYNAESVLKIVNELKKLGYTVNVKVGGCRYDVCANIDRSKKTVTIRAGNILGSRLSNSNPEEHIFKARCRNYNWVIEE